MWRTARNRVLAWLAVVASLMLATPCAPASTARRARESRVKHTSARVLAEMGTAANARTAGAIGVAVHETATAAPEAATNSPSSVGAANPTIASASAVDSTATSGVGEAAAGTRPLPIDLDAVRKTLAAIPALAAFAASFVPFSDSDVDAALRRGGRSRQGIQLWTTMPSLFAWNPVPDKTLWVLSGRVGARALLAVLEPSKDGRIAHAESTLIDEPEATLALGASSKYPTQLTWSTCYGCVGEGGTVRFADDGRVQLTYR